MKTFLTFVALVITVTTHLSAQEWRSIPYPEFVPYTNDAFTCNSDIQGNIWTQDGLSINGKDLLVMLRFDVSTEKWTRYSLLDGNLPNDSTIYRTILQRNGGLIAITPTSMYVPNSSSSWNRVLFPEIGSHTSPILTIDVRDIMEDKDGNIWVLRNLRFNGINVSHVSRYDGTQWTSWCTDIPLYSYQGVNANQFRTFGNYRTIKQAPNGDIWMIGSNGFALDSDTATWDGGGITRWDGKGWKFWLKELGRAEGGLNDNATNFVIDEKNRLIIAQPQLDGSPQIAGGITVFDNGVYTFYRQDNGSIPPDTALGLPGRRFGNLYLNELFNPRGISVSGSSWYINTIGHGILEFDGTTWKAIANGTNGLTNGGPGFDIAVDKNGDIWATFLSSKLIRLSKRTTSVDFTESEKPFAIAPNPAQQSIRVFLPDEGNSNGNRFTALSVVNTLGVTMLTIQEPTTDMIDVSSLANGAYFLRATTTRGKTITKPFVIER